MSAQDSDHGCGGNVDACHHRVSLFQAWRRRCCPVACFLYINRSNLQTVLTPHTTFTQQTKTIRNERDTKFLSTPLRNQVFSLDQTFEPWFVYTSISQTFLVMELFTTSEYLRNTFVLITSEIEPATLRVVAQCLTQLRNHVPLLRTYVFRKYSLILKSSMTKNVWEMLV